MRPLPNTIRPCRDDVAHRNGGDSPVERFEHVVFPVHHVAACCLVGAVGWAGLIAASRAVLDVVVQFV